MIMEMQILIITLFCFCEYRTACSNINRRNKQAIYNFSNLARLVGKKAIKETKNIPSRKLHVNMDDIMNLDTAEFLNIIKDRNYENVGAGEIRRRNQNNKNDNINLKISEFLTETYNSKHENNTTVTEKIGRENENKKDEIAVVDTAKFLNINETENSQYNDNVIDTGSIEQEAQKNYDAIVNLDTAEFLNVLKTGNHNYDDNIIGMRKMSQHDKNKKYIKRAQMEQIISSNKHVDESVRNIQEKISNIKIESYPFLASIQIFDECLCAGAIIQRNLIITAASCLKKLYRKTNDFKEIKVGVASDFCDKDGQLLQVYKIHFHHLYDPWTHENNLALIQVNEDLITERYKNTMMIFIEYNTRALTYGRKVVNITILGWGDKTKQNELNTLPKRITKTEQTYYDREKCREIYKRRYVTEKSFCGKSFTEQASGCNKDVGNPALFKGRLVGIINYGPTTCNIPNTPTVFTKLSSYKLWIETVMVMAMAEVINFDPPPKNWLLLDNLENMKNQQKSTNYNKHKIKVIGNILRNENPNNHEKPEKELDDTIYKDYDEEPTETVLGPHETMIMFSGHQSNNVSIQPLLNSGINETNGKSNKERKIFAPSNHEKPGMELDNKIYEDSNKELTKSVLEPNSKIIKLSYKIISPTPLSNNGTNMMKNNAERNAFIHGKHKKPGMELANTFNKKVTKDFLKSTEKTRTTTGHLTHSIVSLQPILRNRMNNTKGKSSTERNKLVPNDHGKLGMKLDNIIYKYSDGELTEAVKKYTKKTKKPLYKSELVELLLKNGINKQKGKINAEGNFIPNEHEIMRMKLYDTTYKEINKAVLKSHEKSRTYSGHSTYNIVSLKPLINNVINKTKGEMNTERIKFIPNKQETTELNNTIYNYHHTNITKSVLRPYAKIGWNSSFPTYKIRQTSLRPLFDNSMDKTKGIFFTAQDEIIHNKDRITVTKSNNLIFKDYRKEIMTGSKLTSNTVSLQPLVNNSSQPLIESGKQIHIPVSYPLHPAERRNKKKVQAQTKVVPKEHEQLESESESDDIFQVQYKGITEESHKSTRYYEKNGIVGGRTWIGKSKKYLLKTSEAKENNDNQKSFTNKVTPKIENLYPRSQESAVTETGVEGTTCNSYEEFVAPYIKKRLTQHGEPILHTIGRITKIDTEELGFFGVSNAFDKNSLESLNNRGGIYY